MPDEQKRRYGTYRFPPEMLKEIEEVTERLKTEYPEVTKTRIMEASFQHFRDLLERGKLPLQKLLGQP